MFTLKELTSIENTEWMKTRTALTWATPAFSHIFYSLLNNTGTKHLAVFTEDIPATAATDGSNIVLYPKLFFGYKLQERIFILAHEILHCVFDHPRLNNKWQKQGHVLYADGTKLPFDHTLMNVAEDLHINALLITTGVGQYNRDWLYEPALYAETKSVLDIYKEMVQWTRRRINPLSENQEAFDDMLPPGVTLPSNEPAPERNKAQWEATVAAAVHLAEEQAKHLGKLQGNKASALARALGKTLEPVIDWKDKLHGCFARKVGSDRYDWKRPNRRFVTRGIITPARSGFGTGQIVVACDVSGSMGNDDITRCFNEVAGILETTKPERLSLLWCDTEVHRVDEIEDISDLYAVKKKDAPQWGGGTDFRPVFHWIQKKCWNDPDCLVFLTDGYGDFPTREPKYPVFWVSISAPGEVKYPFGEVIHMPHKAH